MAILISAVHQFAPAYLPSIYSLSTSSQSLRMQLASALSIPFQNLLQQKLHLHEESYARWSSAGCSGGGSPFLSKIAMVGRARIRCMNVEQRSMGGEGRCGCAVCGRRALFGLVGEILCGGIGSCGYGFENREENDMKTLEMIHPQRPDWYEEVFAQSMLLGMQSYEAEVATYKLQLFNQLDNTVERILELGVGTGPNMRYYANRSDVTVIGVDPNRHMEKYARDAATTAGLSCSQFKFLHAVAERLPIPDSSVDAIVCTLVLCSVKDVSAALREVRRVLKPGGSFLFVEHVAAKEGTWLRMFQNLLGPLQVLVADGCHLDRDTLEYIQRAGFTSSNARSIHINNIALISPHIVGTAQN